MVAGRNPMVAASVQVNGNTVGVVEEDTDTLAQRQEEAVLYEETERVAPAVVKKSWGKRMKKMVGQRMRNLGGKM